MSILTSILNKHYRAISKEYVKTTKRIKNGEIPVATREWLLDNFYIIEEQANLMRRDFSYSKTRMEDDIVLEIARKLVRDTDGIITRDNIVESFDDGNLYDSSIWKIPSILKLAIIERISSILAGGDSWQIESASTSVSMGRAITSLRTLASINMVRLFPKISKVDRLLSEEDSVYRNMTEESKEFYRQRVEQIARKKKLTPFEVAQTALGLAKTRKRHVGYFLVTTQLGKTNGREKGAKRWAYAYTAILATALSIAVVGLLGGALAAILFAIPASDIVLNLLNYIVTKTTKPTFIPRMDYSLENGGIPEEFSTFIVIPAMISTAEQGKKLLEQLEVFSLANVDTNLNLALICDTKSPHEQIRPLLEKKVEELNTKYGEGKFTLFMRETAWERKRGALIEFAKFAKEKGMKYIITLDSDTQLHRGKAAELVGAMAHPLNRPKISKSKHRVVHGYGIMQPRVTTDVCSANASLFSKIFAGQGGIDSYSSAVSDVYQDLFEEGIFTGKGIFDIDTFLKILPPVIKENTVLSHDLLEGCFLRCALLGDVNFVDSFPAKYSAHMSRLHRWIRGDWQLLPYLSRKCKLNGVSKWKILDNMRRSLLPITLSAMLVFRTEWVFLVLLTLCSQLLISTIEWAIGQGYKRSGTRLHATVIYGLKGVIYQTVFLLMTLLHSAIISIDAISRTLWRVIVSKKNLLQWTTAAESESMLKGGVAGEYKRMWLSVVVAGVAFVLTEHYLLLLWIIAPLFTAWTSRIHSVSRPNISNEDRHILRQLARRTWQYYEDFATADTNWLVPDNYQENPPNGLALRTSPTNIGMHMMAALTAFDLGYISLNKLITILERILNTLDKLEKWNGNLYNWYDIQTLKPLHPRYVSTVDSGNLLGYILTVVETLKNIETIPDMEQGLEDVMKLATHPRSVWQKPAQEQMRDMQNSGPADPTSVIARLESLAENMQLSPLYDKELDLFSIGFNAEQQQITNSYYDLLASEARQSVYIAVSRGEIPARAWKRLGRSLVMRDGYRGLVSWTGSMFEYLMPLLIMGNISNTLLDETYHFCIRAQRKYAKMRGIPCWGSSESGFNSFDIDLNYQYKAFGIPDLGVSRGILSDVVIAPYATSLALMVDYEEAMANIKIMNENGFCGTYGMYEAVDFTPKRVLSRHKFSIVKSYMAHHQGMTLLAINNVLNNNILQHRFGRIPMIKSAEELLTERVPTSVLKTREKRRQQRLVQQNEDMQMSVLREFRDVGNASHIISSGNVSVFIGKNGEGWTKRRDMFLNNGDYVYVTNLKTGQKFNAFQGAVSFAAHKAEFVVNTKEGLDISSTVLPCADRPAKLINVIIANNSDDTAHLQIDTYSEIILATRDEHYAHPAFAKLFTTTQNTEESIVFARKGKYATYRFKLSVEDDEISPTIETSRGQIWGRGRSLDPISAFSFSVEIKPQSSARLSGVIAFGDEAGDVDFAHAMELAESRSQIEAKHMGVPLDSQILALENLDFATRRFHQNKLWFYGISGDFPIFVHVFSGGKVQVEKLLGMHKFLQYKGLRTDLVLITPVEADYLQPIAGALREIVDKSDVGGNVHVLCGMSEREIELIKLAGKEV